MDGLSQLVAGSTFASDFRILRPLSQGGMGALYVVEQLSTGKQRALKLMHPQLVSQAALRKRFEQEARIGARIESDHVVEVIGAGVDEGTGMPWLAMELLQGEDLESYAAKRGALPVPEVLAIFDQLCHALGAAHAQGIVHRDLKPANLFLAVARRRGAPFMVKVLDFGIAKVLAEAKTLTSAIGTPLWMAPEQAEAGHAIAPMTDVWALGLIAFNLLTGGMYWKGAAEGASTFALMREILFEPLVPATVRAAELGVALPDGFDAWFARCVVRAAGERYRDASAAFAALQPMLQPAVATLSQNPPQAVHVTIPIDASIPERISAAVQTEQEPAGNTVPAGPGWRPPEFSAPPPSEPAARIPPYEPKVPLGKGRRTLWILGIVAGAGALGAYALAAASDRKEASSEASKLETDPSAPARPALAPSAVDFRQRTEAAMAAQDGIAPPSAAPNPSASSPPSASSQPRLVPLDRASIAESKGHLPSEVIQRIVRQNFGRFRSCYEQGLRRNPQLTGQVKVRFVIGSNGTVSSASNAGSELPDAEVVSCSVKAFYGLKFPAPEGGAVVAVYPFMFSPG
ncbi:MAG: AgmX/PglI C-terminal domain-containing protein [Pseudomonadota bacterium]